MRRPTTLLITLCSLLTLGPVGCDSDDGVDPVPEAGTNGEDSSDPTESEPDPEPDPGTTTGVSDPDGGESDDDGTDSGSDDMPDSGETAEETTGEPGPGVEERLEGHWVSQICEPMPQADGSTLYFLRDFTLDVSTWSITGTIYGDEACSFPLLTLDIGGDYSVVGPAAGIEGAFEADFDRSRIELTPHVQDFVDWFNAEGCGSEVWVAGELQDVTEAGCAFIPSSADCPVEYDLVSPDDDTLYFGSRPVDGDMCSAAKRPEQLGDHPVVRQDA